MCTFAHGETEIRTKNQNNMSNLISGVGNDGRMGNQGMPMMNMNGMNSMNQFMPGLFPPMDPSIMYGMGMNMMPNSNQNTLDGK